MSTKPRTIDNLGIETSSRYARDQSKLDPNLIKESGFIPTKAEVSVIKPYLPTDLEEYFYPDQLSLWGAFSPPPEMLKGTSLLFTHQLIPSLGTDEKQEALEERLEALEDTLQKKKKRKTQIVEDERKRKVLLHLVKTIRKLDRTLSMINARRNQYQRG